MAAAGAPHSSLPDPSPTKPKRRVFFPPCRSHRPIGPPPPPPPTSSSGLLLQPRSRLSPFVPHPSPPPTMAPRKARVSSRNPDLIRGIGKFSRSKMYHKRGIWAIKAKNGGVLPRHDAAPAAPKPEEKAPKFYPADDVKQPIANRRKARPTKLRASISPGTVLILLAGRFMGKRVVFLKQLTSGLLLVTGPYKVNGVPIRRVNQAYVIGTSTKVDISGVNVDKFDDKYFVKETKSNKKKTEGEFFEADEKEKKEVSQERKDDQKVVDSEVVKAIEAVPDLKIYLGARFSLRSGMKPHELVF